MSIAAAVLGSKEKMKPTSLRHINKNGLLLRGDRRSNGDMWYVRKKCTKKKKEQTEREEKTSQNMRIVTIAAVVIKGQRTVLKPTGTI